MYLAKYFLTYMLIGFVLQTSTGQDYEYSLVGLQKEVEIIVDNWGIPHIYARTEADLFFAQGFYAAQDRLFQFEMWRRQATGTVAEILGERELKRDIGTRLFKFRGDLEKEMNHYHPKGALIITSFVQGVNAYIALTEKDTSLLPLEFELLGIKPQKWTPEIVISRHQGLLGNIKQELKIARAVSLLNPDKVKELYHFHPGDPDIKLHPDIFEEDLFEDLLELYNAFRQPIAFRPEDLIASASNRDWKEFQNLVQLDEQARWNTEKFEWDNLGSNNWVVSGKLTQSGYPIMANDPHRSQAAPSLRYMAHLVGPNWNVIGGGEPEIPGISIGHNEHGAWGLTVFQTDAEDLYVYTTHPENPDQYFYQNAWEDMNLMEESIPVKGKDDVKVTFKYTRHGPVVYQDKEKFSAYAMRCGWMEIGGAPYLASLRMDQAQNWEEFRAACSYSHIPGENMVWADREGNIGWQAVGIAPIRRNFSGLVPVPGDGSFEWDGYLPIMDKPHVFNPSEGYIATSNENVTPPTYPHMDAIGFTWSDPFRGSRVREFLASGRKHTIMDMAQLQTDYLSLPARTLVPLLKNLTPGDEIMAQAIAYLFEWDFKMEPSSIAAAIYHKWERRLISNIRVLTISEEALPYITTQLTTVINELLLPDGSFGDDPLAGRDALLLESLGEAIDELTISLGPNMLKWEYGQPEYKHIIIKHPLSNAVNSDIRKKLGVGPAVRGGNSYTVNNTSSNDNQSSGASFRIIVDTENWDHCIGTNAPGQGGDPDDKHYKNLFDTWANDRYFPIFYSRPKILSVKDEVWTLKPQ